MSLSLFEQHWSNVAVIAILTILGFLAQDKLQAMSEQDMNCAKVIKENTRKIDFIENRVIILETEIPHVSKSLEEMSKEVKRIRVIIENSREERLSQ